MAHNRAVTGSNPVRLITVLQKDKPRKIDSGINTNDFEKYLRLQKSLSESRVKSHIGNLKIFLKSGLNLDDFMLKVKNERAVSTYRDYLCTMKVFYRDYMKEPEAIPGHYKENIDIL